MIDVGVIGAGFVGAASANAIALSNTCSELVLLDKNHERAVAEAADIAHGAAIAGSTRVRAGDYEDLKGAKVVVIAAGVNQKPGESRLDLLARNTAIFGEIVPQVAKYAPEAVVVIATNPVDIMTDVTRSLHPNPELVLGTGTLLDTARFRGLISQASHVSARYIHATVLGEHGDSSVLCWDSARVAGLDLDTFMQQTGADWSAARRSEIEDKVRGAAAKIIAGKQATYYGIGASVMKIVSGILGDRRGIYTLSTPSDYGVCLSLPCVLGKDGIIQVLKPNLSAKEQEGLEKSAAVLKETRDSMKD